MRFKSRLSVLFVLCLSLLPRPTFGQVINDRHLHLGRAGAAEWDEFTTNPPDAQRLDLTFQAEANNREATLFIRQEDVRQDWLVELNGRRIGMLFLMEADLISSLKVPAGTLLNGENRLVITPPSVSDDIVLHRIWLKSGGLDEAIAEGRLEVSVVDGDSRAPIPARITIVDHHGTLVPLTAIKAESASPPVAVRPGVAYVGAAGAKLGLPAGDFTVYASRGFEYGVSSQTVHLDRGGRTTARLSIRHEVPTPGWVSCDTHVHTLTHSGHGDASTDERMLTLAGEGIEMPVATDHNYHTDYREPAAQMGVADFFTPVTGNEVTTRTAHFNIFPVRPDARVADYHIADWPALMMAMRATPAVKVVVLNHPLNVHNGFQPFSPTNFNNVTGEHLRGAKYSFDAIELLNSSAQQSDFMAVYRGWFALLNHGYRITGVGSSDCHDVSRYIVGQGRTYIACPDGDPAHVDVGRACESLLAGRALVSMGLLVDLKVDNRFGVGDLATSLPEQIEITARVMGPAWVQATNVTLFANGQSVRAEDITDSGGKTGEKAVIHWTMPKPSHDVHLVAIATGPDVKAPYWAIPRPYQPTSRHWDGRVIGSTNPIWIDADGDGRFTSARDYALRMIDRQGTDPMKIIPLLSHYDEAIAAQVAGLLDAADVDLQDERLHRALAESTESVRRGFESYLQASAASGK